MADSFRLFMRSSYIKFHKRYRYRGIFIYIDKLPTIFAATFSHLSALLSHPYCRPRGGLRCNIQHSPFSKR